MTLLPHSSLPHLEGASCHGLLHVHADGWHFINFFISMPKLLGQNYFTCIRYFILNRKISNVYKTRLFSCFLFFLFFLVFEEYKQLKKNWCGVWMKYLIYPHEVFGSIKICRKVMNWPYPRRCMPPIKLLAAILKPSTLRLNASVTFPKMWLVRFWTKNYTPNLVTWPIYDVIGHMTKNFEFLKTDFRYKCYISLESCYHWP